MSAGPSCRSAPGVQPAARTSRSELPAYAAASLVFAVGCFLTLYLGRTMSGGMPMPGDWMMSMMWMPMGGRLSSAAIFTGMWLAMMIAMMLPSTMPMLLLYRRVVAFRANRAKTAESTPRGFRVRTATFLLASGYFFVWTLFGVVAYTLGALLANAAMRSETF
ncbi:MAG: DUF2182 domain-containing protein, partial [Acidobacteria bacterium]|nr:DUF2182 domain-containing protein [Acidobacteriota bacterium]